MRQKQEWIKIDSALSEKRQHMYDELGIDSWIFEPSIEKSKKAGTVFSYYGLKDNSEMLAEAIAEIMAGEPRTAAKEIYNILFNQ